MKALVFGAKGLLGSELTRQLKLPETYALDKEDIDITDQRQVAAVISSLKPDVIFNCAAYNFVDQAEDQPAIANKLNAEAMAFIAKSAKQANAILVHYSTGFVFDGASAWGYKENSVPNPQNIYAKSKYLGELEVQKNCVRYYIVRLNLLFGAPGTSTVAKKDFPDLILELAKTKDSLDFIADEISTPTYAPDLVDACLRLLSKKYPFGIYHLINDGQASWYDYACEVFKIKNIAVKVNAVTAEQFSRKALHRAIRPKNSVLINSKFPKLRRWQEALREYLQKDNQKTIL